MAQVTARHATRDAACDAVAGEPMCRRTLLAAGGAALLAVMGCGRRAPRADLVPEGATVLALGDSLTHGTGAADDESYPVVLQRLTRWQVVNAGVPGDRAPQALERLPELLKHHAPRLVLVGIGGNDLLRGRDEAALREDIRRICELSLASGAQVLLIAVPRPTLASAFVGSLTDHRLYAELAEQLRVPLQRQGWSEVLSDENLRSDRVHANAEGYAQFARRLVASARAAGLLPLER